MEYPNDAELRQELFNAIVPYTCVNIRIHLFGSQKLGINSSNEFTSDFSQGTMSDAPTSPH